MQDNVHLSSHVLIDEIPTKWPTNSLYAIQSLSYGIFAISSLDSSTHKWFEYVLTNLRFVSLYTIHTHTHIEWFACKQNYSNSITICCCSQYSGFSSIWFFRLFLSFFPIASIHKHHKIRSVHTEKKPAKIIYYSSHFICAVVFLFLFLLLFASYISFRFLKNRFVVIRAVIAWRTSSPPPPSSSSLSMSVLCSYRCRTIC